MNWQSWSAAAFREAQETGRPVLLFLRTEWSAGCAEMDRTTFADTRVAALIERLFVPVRVDADLRPDIGERYGLDGWPSTLLLSADGEILQGGTYFDAPALADLLERTSDMYRTSRDEVERRVAAARADRRSPTPGAWFAGPGPSTVDIAESISCFLLARADRARGGFVGTPKFLHGDALLLLSRYGADERAAAARETLDAADRSPLCTDDGAVFRCARGIDWSDPVAEVTAENHATALWVFTEGAVAFGGRYLERVRRLAAFARRRWLVEHGVPLQTDSGAWLAGACLAAARLLDDESLGRDALALVERVCLATYRPGRGVAHFGAANAPRLLTDHVALITALLDAHEATGQAPYSMLAEELGHRLIESFYDRDSAAMRDRVHDADDFGRLAEPAYPYRTNAHAARALVRLGAASGERHFAEVAAQVFARVAEGWREQELDAAACGIAALDLIHWPDR